MFIVEVKEQNGIWRQWKQCNNLQDARDSMANLKKNILLCVTGIVAVRLCQVIESY